MNCFNQKNTLGKQYPILLRLRELAKLCAICEILIDKRRCVQNLKNALDHHTSDIAPLEEIFPHMFSVIKNDEHHVLKELADYRYGRNPPHPIYSEDNVQKEWRVGLCFIYFCNMCACFKPFFCVDARNAALSPGQ